MSVDKFDVLYAAWFQGIGVPLFGLQSTTWSSLVDDPNVYLQAMHSGQSQVHFCPGATHKEDRQVQALGEPNTRLFQAN
ncbi:MAG: hypothetical protein KDB03_04925 [Planctomycetales bacterium]|nr:hypothetical protein [Planctomycetales bacterium]